MLDHYKSGDGTIPAEDSMKPAARVSTFLLVTAITLVGVLPDAGVADDKPQEKPKSQLLPDDPKAVAARVKALSESAPQGGKLAAYLNCGTQRQSAAGKDVTISWKSGQPYLFRSEAKDVPATQPTIFFDANRVAFELAGLDRARRYMVGLTWWDYDAGGRTQMVTVGSPDERTVRIGVPAIGLPNYTESGQLPGQRQFHLPVTFAREGRMSLVVQKVTGANTVISELWVWQIK
jgi:hypothetical protein